MKGGSKVNFGRQSVKIIERISMLKNEFDEGAEADTVADVLNEMSSRMSSVAQKIDLSEVTEDESIYNPNSKMTVLSNDIKKLEESMQVKSNHVFRSLKLI